MPYFKHAELVNRYHVSLKTVHNWIDASKQGKLELELFERGSRTYVADTTRNTATLRKLSDEGKKYRNSRFQSVTTPAPVFYETFSRQQILDIITSLNVHREIPRQYNYLGEGAIRWDEYTRKLLESHDQSLLRNTIELLRLNLGSIDELTEGHKRINVVDVGPGNGLPVRELLQHLMDRGVLHRYIAVDISAEMLKIAEHNIVEWFGNKVKFEGYVRDITHEHFDDVLVDDMLGPEGDATINLVLLLGATPMNVPTPNDMLRTVHGSMGHEDLLVYTDKPDSEAVRRHFIIDINTHGAQALSPIHSYIFSLLNIDESLYDVETGFNSAKHIRYIRARLKSSLTLKFQFESSERHVNLEKGEAITLWRVWDLPMLDIVTEFERAGFTLLQSSMTKDREYLLTISGIEKKLDNEL